MCQRIEDYALIGDLHTAALVGRDGSIDWLCLPRFDSPACFAALLDGDEAGRWLLAPVEGGSCTRRAYRRDTLILETEWVTATGSVRVTDCMPVRRQTADVVRVVEGVTGSVRMQTELRLRFDYGHIVPWVRRVPGCLTAVAGPDAVWLRTPVPLRGHDMRTTGQFDIHAGDTVPFVLTYGLSYEHAPRPLDARQAIFDTDRYWTDWIDSCDYSGEHTDAVRRSLITLEALTYRPTGGIVAAATTSLPEQIGGSRNWDYRYCWLRDAAFTLQALLGCGFVAEAKAWRNWLVRAVAGDPADLQMVYRLDGARRVPEFALPWLSGYNGSAPVRVGNAAAEQFQLDVWGEVLDCLHLARENGLRGDPAWDIEVALLDFLEGHWHEPDNGLWEIRGQPRPFVHSKVMAWAGVDRGVRAVERFGLPGPVDRWRALREQIRTEILQEGFDARRGTFTQFYGSRGVDAALLLIPRTGFLPWDDPRVVGTVSTIERELGRDGFILRYRPELEQVDGIAEPEATFVACSFWLADALYGAGRVHDARELFERVLSVRNDVGLFAEEYDPDARRQLGNVPQAFSHVALVNTARHLSGYPVGTHRPDPR
ncbi:glycoside hydrolase family 15 protein [Rhodococcus rhodochrous]|uniref:glycoside hydrolase family 15 protein n=1 Tax=Rhodococcus rhodochrous TaxID=1829 RepID=UPI000374807E|nr:glycoside hydrolase family 15 protein [Rhodococcus rhodochrous]